jgi:hypothetical protein
VRNRLLRGTVTMATLIRFLATQVDQHALGKEFGVRQPCVSKRIRRAYKALLTAYYWTDCPHPKIFFPTDDAQRHDASEWFFNKSSGIPFIIGAIDGTIVNCSAPFESQYMPKEFWNSRKHSYAFNVMLVCNHQKKFTYVDSRWPGSTNDTGILHTCIVFNIQIYISISINIYICIHM